MREQAYILYIEDELDTLQLVTILLENNGYKVIGAPNGETGLKLMREQKPDAVLLDLMLPGISGKVVYSTMKNDRALEDIPIVIITAWRVTSEHGLSAELVDEYLLKPFNARDLLNALQKVLNP